MTEALRVNPVLRELTERAFLRLMPPARRGFIQFAEQELILPSGPRKGLPYRVEFMPFARELLTEYTRGRYNEFYLSGPTQSSKTLHGYILPAMYHLLECAEDIILGAPVVEMAQAAYLERLLPALESSRYLDLLPTHGGGSKGGKSLSVRFKNGASVRFMGAGGGDQQRSSYTARVIICTELDKMDEAGSSSRETDPVSQLKARSSAYGAAARFYGECTMSVKSGRIYREVVERGTDSRVFLPCVHCGEWILPSRDGLVGWQESPDVMQACQRVRFQCPSCRGLWTEEDRAKAHRDPRIVAKGQTVSKTGEVEGPPPPTMTYGFRWNAMASPLRSMADIAKEEWNAEQSGKPEEEKALVQFTWAEAWEEEVADVTRPEVGTILAKITGYARGVIPPDTVKLTLGIDVGSYVIWWTLVAWKGDAQGHVVDFGGRDVPDGKKNPAAVLAALRAFRSERIIPGWGGRSPDRVLIDSGYEQNVVYQFVKESGEPRYLACKGYGTSSRHGAWRNPSASVATDTRAVYEECFVTLQPAGVRLVNVHADHWKTQVHAGFAAASGAPGSLTIWHGEKTDEALRVYARMIVAEQRELKTFGDKEPRIVWVLKNKTNHYLDTTAYARCAAALEGIRLVSIPAPIAKKRSAAGGGGLKWQRDRY